ncbi:MAG: hypothetical protein J0L52_00965 [Caulobacterales bacterium]|nr:hypothetical protein [Caulobacterales bacterium]
MAQSLLRSLVSRGRRAVRRLDGLVVTPCEGPDRDLCVVWDPIEEQIVDVLPASRAGRYGEEDDLWAEARGWATSEPAYAAAA